MLTKLNDDSILVPDKKTVPAPPGFVTPDPASVPNPPPAKTVLAPNAEAYYERQMLNSALQVSPQSDKQSSIPQLSHCRQV